ncbi:hypothetical protein BT96DRAFT_947322 [Gymnopus androsaceus JB14]|uniref:Uncharacterized protein n=1 Tax=Gymnopus androsaceus JB14 TaxID=1447944 RepID=A0A6A4GSZ7_9AGAR|nr:hypothetical protein BT96DRAFT_947322 [Gymnopus androsaceus JB14]
MNMKKAEDKQCRAVELWEKLKNIPLICDISEIDAKPQAYIDKKGSGRWTGHLYNSQLDNSTFPKQDALIAGFGLYLEQLEELGRQWLESLENSATVEGGLGMVEDAVDRDEIEVD